MADHMRLLSDAADGHGRLGGRHRDEHVRRWRRVLGPKPSASMPNHSYACPTEGYFDHLLVTLTTMVMMIVVINAAAKVASREAENGR
jgi:hypothetical protein